MKEMVDGLTAQEISLCADQSIGLHVPPMSSEGVDMKITSVSMNRPLSKAQGSIKKISPLMKPLTMAVGGVNNEDSLDEPEPDLPRPNRQSQRQNPIDTLGSEVDVWV
jgi:hypothetical protein